MLQAAIAALHDEATSTDAADWQQILILFKLLEHRQPNPIVTLNRAVAEAMMHGPLVGLEILAQIETHPVMRRNHRLLAVRAHLHERAGNPVAACTDYSAAARLTSNIAEQQYLRRRAARLRGHAMPDREPGHRQAPT